VVYAAPKLAVDRIALHQFEDGPVRESSYEFLPGETAHFSCRFSGYQTQALADERQQVKLSWHMEVRDPLGALLEEPAQGRIDAELFAEDTNWLPKFLKDFEVPQYAISGEYRITVRAQDEIAGGGITGELKFLVKGHAPDAGMEAGGKLTAHEVMFLSSEDDALGTRSGLYHPGGTVWARMDVSGYKFGEKNRFSISYGMALEDADGKELFSQPDTGTDTQESYYPQRYAIDTLSLNLDKNLAAGAYTLVVTVHDTIGDRAAEVRAPFRVQ
jgi:hypothetical protein